MELLILVAVAVSVTAMIMAIIDARAATSLATQARLDRASGRVEFAGWSGPRMSLRGNRMSNIVWLERLLAEVDFAKRIELKLMRADWNMRVAEFLAICALTAGFGFALGMLILHIPIIAILFGLILGAIPFVILRMAMRRRIRTIEKQLIEVLTMMANALRAGFGLMQAVDQAAKQIEDPIAGELKQMIRDTQIGSSIEEAVAELSRRIGSYEIDIVCTAILVQRNVGGNLADIFDTVAHTMRERERIKGEINTLTVQQKLTGFIIGLLPPGLAALFFVLNPDYMSLLFTEPIGRIMLGAGLIGEFIGMMVIRKIVNIEV